MIFLAQTEKAYFDGMYSFIKKNIGSKALVTGTMVFGPLGLWAQSDLDYIDNHAYWQHPSFPGKPWDGANWLVEQKAMVDHPGQSTLFRLAAAHLAGKPYTVSEYNHPAPNDYQAECVPMVAAWGAAQDWDGIWLFAYSHSEFTTTTDHFFNFFDIAANPAKWGFVPAGAKIFRDAGIEPFKILELVGLPRSGRLVRYGDKLPDLAELQLRHGLDMYAIVQQPKIDLDLNVQVFVDFSYSLQRKGVYSLPAHMTWGKRADGKGVFSHYGDADAVLINAEAPTKWPKFEICEKGLPSFAFKTFALDKPAFTIATVVALDGQPFWGSRKILITACGRCENTGMEFSKDRRTVGTKWGKAPVRIEPVQGTIELELPREGKYRCQALDAAGLPGKTVEIVSATTQASGPATATIKLDASYGTMWYLITRE